MIIFIQYILNIFKDKTLISFWMPTKKEYPSLSKQILQCIYLFVCRFPELFYFKTKYRSKFDIENKLQVEIGLILH